MSSGLRAERPLPLPRRSASAGRDRIYSKYVSGRATAIAPDTFDGMASRALFLDHIIRRHLPPDRDVAILDLGCGYGSMVHRLRRAGYVHVVGVDGSVEQLEAGARLGIDGLQAGDLFETLSARDPQSVDVLLLLDVLEHFTKDEVFALVDQSVRVLAPGGRLLIHAPNAESPFGGRMLFWDITHEIAFTRESIAQLLLAAGFGEVACFEDRPIVHGVASAVRRVLWQAIRAVWGFCLLVETGGMAGAIFSQSFLTVAVKSPRR